MLLCTVHIVQCGRKLRLKKEVTTVSTRNEISETGQHDLHNQYYGLNIMNDVNIRQFRNKL